MNPSYIKKVVMKTLNLMNDNNSSFVKCPGIDFSRNRKCSFLTLITFILSMESHTLNTEIRRFFSPKGLPVISKSAFIQQRDKLNEKVFPYLFSTINNIFPFCQKMNGYHLIAVDGSDVNLPPLKDDKNTYVRSNTSDVGYHQLHLNAAYDLLEERYIDILPQPRAIYDEREALLTFVHRNPLPDKCLYIADRGYLSFNVLANLYTSKDSFLLRISNGCNSFLKRFELPESDEFDIILNFSFTRSAKNIYLQQPDKYIYIRNDCDFDLIPRGDKDTLFPVSVRLVKIRIANGFEYLLTDLPSKSFSMDKLKELYRMRWGIETSFRYLKYNVALNYFHSVRRDFIMQEIYARVIVYNLTMLLVHCVKPRQSTTKYRRKISVSDAVVTFREFLIHRIKNEEIIASLLRYQTDIRPQRTFIRKKHSKRFVGLSNRA